MITKTNKVELKCDCGAAWYADSVSDDMKLTCPVCEFKEVDTFEPKAEEWCVYGDGAISNISNDSIKYVSRGMARATKEQAEELSRELKAFARLDAYAIEKGYKLSYVENTYLYSVLYDTTDASYDWFARNNVKDITTTYMTKEGAKATCNALNSGELVL